MINLKYIIKSQNGIHARPAGCLAKFAQNYPDVRITIFHSDKECEVRNMLSVMKLGLKQNDTVTFNLDGPDQERENEIKEKLNILLDNLDGLLADF